jgi:hypothetical protein
MDFELWILERVRNRQRRSDGADKDAVRRTGAPTDKAGDEDIVPCADSGAGRYVGQRRRDRGSPFIGAHIGRVGANVVSLVARRRFAWVGVIDRGTPLQQSER